MKLSPQLNFAIDSLSHGIEHYKKSNRNDLVFALLHFETAIEMILKGILIKSNRPVYKGGKRSLELEECIKKLTDKLSITEGENFQTLHSLRNDVKHMGILADNDIIRYYLEESYPYIKRLLKEELGIKIEEVIKSDLISSIENNNVEISLDLDALESGNTSTENAQNIIHSYAALESLAKMFDPTAPLRSALKEMANMNKFVKSPSFKVDLDNVFSIRSQVVHQMLLPTQEIVKTYEKSIKNISKALQPALIMNTVSGSPSGFEEEKKDRK